MSDTKENKEIFEDLIEEAPIGNLNITERSFDDFDIGQYAAAYSGPKKERKKFGKRSGRKQNKAVEAKPAAKPEQAVQTEAVYAESLPARSRARTSEADTDFTVISPYSGKVTEEAKEPDSIARLRASRNAQKEQEAADEAAREEEIANDILIVSESTNPEIKGGTFNLKEKAPEPKQIGEASPAPAEEVKPEAKPEEKTAEPVQAQEASQKEEPIVVEGRVITDTLFQLNPEDLAATIHEPMPELEEAARETKPVVEEVVVAEAPVDETVVEEEPAEEEPKAPKRRKRKGLFSRSKAAEDEEAGEEEAEEAPVSGREITLEEYGPMTFQNLEEEDRPYSEEELESTLTNLHLKTSAAASTMLADQLEEEPEEEVEEEEEVYDPGASLVDDYDYNLYMDKKHFLMSEYKKMEEYLAAQSAQGFHYVEHEGKRFYFHKNIPINYYYEALYFTKEPVDSQWDLWKDEGWEIMHRVGGKKRSDYGWVIFRHLEEPGQFKKHIDNDREKYRFFRKYANSCRSTLFVLFICLITSLVTGFLQYEFKGYPLGIIFCGIVFAVSLYFCIVYGRMLSKSRKQAQLLKAKIKREENEKKETLSEDEKELEENWDSLEED